MAAIGRSPAPTAMAPSVTAARMSAPVLRAMHVFERAASRPSVPARHASGRRQIDRLAADHARALRPRRRARATARNRRSAHRRPRRSGSSAGGGCARTANASVSSAVAREDRQPIAVHDVRRRPPAPQRVVVHRRQIVVDERVRVNHLDGDAAAGSASACASATARRGRAGAFGGRQRQARPQPLAAGRARSSASRSASSGGVSCARRRRPSERVVDRVSQLRQIRRRGLARRAARRVIVRRRASSEMRAVLEFAALGHHLDAALGGAELVVAIA